MDVLLRYSPLLYFTQSLWRDEAFSILVAQRPMSEVLGKLTFEPPLYYILLHFWIKLFGTSEVATRSLSLVGFSLATIVVIVWAEKLFKKHWLSWFLPLFFFINPMLLYYAFEVRTYGWYIFFATLSFYTYKEKKWFWYIVATVAGFYTHAYMIFVPFVQAIHYVAFANIPSREWLRFPKKIFVDPMIRSLALIALLVAPWVLRFTSNAAKLKQSWYFPVDFHLIKSVLGNMFIGFEGTPWYLWNATGALSLALLTLFLFAMSDRKNVKRNAFFFLMIFLPLTLVIGVSFIKPLFVNRYLIPVTIAEVFLVVFALAAVKNHVVQKSLGLLVFLLTIAVNIWYPSAHPKLPIRNTMMQINALRSANDVVLAKSPLIFFETIYYSNSPKRVFLYNPSGSPFPWYVGDIIVSQSQIVSDLPQYPTRAFMVDERGYYEVAYRTLTPVISLKNQRLN